jgi:hypothetical protein
LKTGGTVVEYTGISPALVCAAKDYNLRIVPSDAFSGRKDPNHAGIRGSDNLYSKRKPQNNRESDKK